MPELEIDKVEHAGGFGLSGQGLGLRDRRAERLVTEHGVARVDPSPHVVGVQERRRVDGDQVDIGSAKSRDGRRVPRRHDVDHLAANPPEYRRHHPRAEAGSHHADSHWPKIIHV
jgi:hypothetical protein